MVTRRRFLAGCTAVPVVSYLSLNSSFAATPPTMLVIAMQLDNITSLDPHESFEATGGQICGNLYQRLVTPDPKQADKVIGQLAQSWDVSSDNGTLHVPSRSGGQIRRWFAAYRRRRGVLD